MPDRGWREPLAVDAPHTGAGRSSALEKGTLNLSIPEPYIVSADAQLVGNEYCTGETIKFQRCVV